MPRLSALVGLALLALPACDRQPEPEANFALEPPAAPAATTPPEALGKTDVRGDAVALERTLIPELDGVPETAGRWTAANGQARFIGAGGIGLAFACDAGNIVIVYRPDRAPADNEQSLTLLTERGANLFTAVRPPADPAVVTARFTAQLPFFRDALSAGGSAGEGVIGVTLGSRRAVAIPSDPSVAPVIRDCR